MPEQQEQDSQEKQQSVSHPSFELKERISQAVILQLVSESQLVLQNLLSHQEVFDNLAIYYPKTYESIVQLVSAFEQLSVLLQEVGALQDVQEQEPKEDREKEPAKKKSPGGKKSEVEGKKRHKAVEGEEKQVLIGGRSYRRVYHNGAWHYMNRGQKGSAAPTPAK